METPTKTTACEHFSHIEAYLGFKNSILNIKYIKKTFNIKQTPLVKTSNLRGIVFGSK